MGDITSIHAASRPDAIAAKFEGRVTTYLALHENTNRVANALLSSGISKGDHIAYLAKNTDYFFEMLLGGAKMGAISLPIGWRLAAAEVAYLLKDGDVKLLFVGAEFGVLAREAIELSGLTVRVIELESDAAEGYAAWRDASSKDSPDVEVVASDVALQLYTSGTTGHPKGVMLSHSNLLQLRIAAAQSDIASFRWPEDEPGLLAMPIAHIGGTIFGVIAYLNGATNVIVREFDPKSVLELLVSERISKTLMVPAALNFLLQVPGIRSIDFSQLKSIYYGASPIPLDLLKQCMDIFKCDFCQQYGMTETTATIAFLPPEDHDPEGNQRMRSAGVPMPGVELKIIDSDGNTLPQGQVGEVVTRSASNMAGYWRNDAATSQTVDGDGWLRTGDAGYIDGDGYLFIHDRVKDMIISGAENIYPAEVESAMFGHPDIAEVAVIGVPSEKWGEEVKAVVALKLDAPRDAESLIEFTRERIAAFKVPKSVDFVQQLPRNESGKVLKRILREPYWAGKTRNVN